MAKIVPKASKRRLVFLGPIALFIIIYFLFTVGIYGFKLFSLSQKEIELKEKLVSLQAEEQDLKIEIQKLKDPDYLARYARENYLYSKDGEYIIKIEKNKEEKEEEKNYDKYYEYVIYGAGIILVLVFIYILIRSRKK
ncbi:MAG: septum formation initiator family protein [Firmicutes bacterium]|nr:septum formation initiator family protein [Bacillota bacterium]